MAKRRDITSKLVAVIPALLGVGAGLVSALQPENLQKLQAFFANPLNVGVLTAYGAVVLSIITVIIFQVFLSARTSERREAQNEEASDLAIKELPEPTEPPTPLTPEQIALKERNRHISNIRLAFSRNRRRMIVETDRIHRNGFLNLLIGILFSIVALGILGYPLFAASAAPSADWISMLERFAPRISVGILVQLIGFFFLRLYVAGESEIHYIRNEITNFESRLIGYHTAASTNDSAAIRDLVKQLVRTERNFKLKKGERTVYSVDASYNDIGQLIKTALKTRKPKADRISQT